MTRQRPDRGARNASSDERYGLSALIPLATILLLIGLVIWLASDRALNGTLEAESADIARHFLLLGDWTVNHMNGAEDYDKPPLYYWVIGLARSVTGAHWELAARLPSLLSVALIMLLFRLVPREEGIQWTPVLLAAAILITSPKVIGMAQMARMDLMLSLFAFASVVFFARYWESPAREAGERNHGYYLFFIAAALAVMTKGPVGFIITGVPVFLFLLLQGAFRELSRVFLGRGMLLFLVIALPWFVYASIMTDGRFFRWFILEENLSRFGNLFSGLQFTTFQRQPGWQYLAHFLWGFFPWALFVPGIIVQVLRDRLRRSGVDGLLVIYILWVIIFFSLSGIKRSDYILPVYPAAAWLVAGYLSLGIRTRSLHRVFLITGGIALLLLLLLALIPLVLSSDAGQAWVTGWLGPDRLQEASPYLSSLGQWLGYILGGILLLGSLWGYGWTLRERLPLIRIYILFQGILLAFFLVMMQSINKVREDTRPYVATIARLVGEQPVYVYRSWDEEYGFYLNRRVPEVNEAELMGILKGDGRDPVSYILIEPKYFKRLFNSPGDVPFFFAEGMPPDRPMYLIANTPPDGVDAAVRSGSSP
jgi:4-amino-4-deoxy-L-arabinose transferase-like glycosyltransferase